MQLPCLLKCWMLELLYGYWVLRSKCKIHESSICPTIKLSGDHYIHNFCSNTTKITILSWSCGKDWSVNLAMQEFHEYQLTLRLLLKVSQLTWMLHRTSTSNMNNSPIVEPKISVSPALLLSNKQRSLNNIINLHQHWNNRLRGTWWCKNGWHISCFRMVITRMSNSNVPTVVKQSLHEKVAVITTAICCLPPVQQKRPHIPTCHNKGKDCRSIRIASQRLSCFGTIWSSRARVESTGRREDKVGNHGRAERLSWWNSNRPFWQWTTWEMQSHSPKLTNRANQARVSP